MTGRDLRALFDPASVAVVGASDDESKYGNWIGAQALRMAPERPVYLVNRRAATVLGRAAYPSLAGAPGPAELVVIAVPAAGFEAAVDEALDAGARAIVGISAGFAELGPEGRALQDRVAKRVRAAGAVLLGPNCLGVADSTTGLTLASNPLPAGPVSLLSQSGNMALELSRFLAGRGLGFARFASLGNQADLGAADLIRACTTHHGTEIVAVYCEDFGDGRAFVTAAAEATSAGKPVLLLTVGASAASVRGARSHTGSMTTDGAVIDAACRAGGVYRVASPRELADLASALRGCAGPVRRVGVIADGGGHGAVASDLAEAAGLAVPEFSPALVAGLRAELPPSANVTNPVDLAGAGERDISSFGRVLAAALADEEVDGVLVTGYFGGYREYGPALAAAEVAEAHTLAGHVRAHGKPVAVHTMHPDSPAARVLAEHGVPVFAAVEDALRTLALLGTGGTVRPAATPTAAAPPVTGDGYAEARALLAAGGVRYPPASVVHTEEQAVDAAERIGYPVVLKALGPVHKSDLGGVALGLRCADELRAAFRDIYKLSGYSVEAMADTAGGVELIAGVHTDPRFGPVAMVGLGGVFTEVLRDVAFALAPVTAETAHGLLTGLRGAALLRGARGRRPVDLDAAARAVAAITQVAAAHPEIAELEVNPLLVTPNGAVGLDARIALA
ncbi:acetate--CoA ligase family protein [Pseudonocardia acaciae]|uniref:acetate--CoA ligase family protein n=1 Tax=Pseudonocardia acaciae TaxID=551276 RepID=UPI00048AB912|nr:acetate--CoA ligase family protein [Pseudonocardia acaciae]